MSNILIINGAKKFAHSNGQLNDTLTWGWFCVEGLLFNG